jgi:hypothetical protein
MGTLFLLAVIGGAFSQLLLKRVGLTALLGFFGFVAYSVYLEFYLPYRGGGASLWPIDIFFGGPCAAFGAGVGACVVSIIQKKRHK